MPRPVRSSLSVVIPALNEEDYVERAVAALEDALAEVVADFEVVVVNDGSTDRTGYILEELRRSRPHLQVVHHEHNQGLGAALRSGFAVCQKDVTFYSDADLPFDFHELVRALRVLELKDADLVAGFRHDRTNEGARRTVYTFVYNWLIRVLFGVFIRDVNFSFKLIRTKMLRELELASTGSFIDAEMIIKTERRGGFVLQMGVDYYKRKYGNSNLSSFSTILGIVREIWVLYPSLRRQPNR
jgi:glycosyltransferase involved in cell wall biosynthesis